ncbi:hypothetical protein Q1M64_07210 (plasmid) [Sinorhizobium meliloti]|nr:hypothetical protein Q1M64_07210 [Sinorhizobium meliloti]
MQRFDEIVIGDPEIATVTPSDRPLLLYPRQ